MSLIKLIKNNIGESYALGLFIIVLSVGIFSLAFMSEENKITGYAALGADMISAPAENNFPEFNDVDSLKTLAPGDYFIDDNGVVYWTGDSRMPAIAKVKEIDDAQNFLEETFRVHELFQPAVEAGIVVVVLVFKVFEVLWGVEIIV